MDNRFRRALLGTIPVILIVAGIVFFLAVATNQTTPSLAAALDDERFTAVVVDPRKQQLQLFWKDSAGQVIGSIEALQDMVEQRGRKLVFAMNGGMFHPDLVPVGLLIQNGIVKNQLNTTDGNGNFYLKPNGVFYLTSQNKPIVCITEELPSSVKGLTFATQSGPMLVYNGRIHPGFNRQSTNLNVRNGVGILPNGNAVFVISRSQVSFFDIAEYFQKLGCQNALYLDGFVSRLYAPKQNWWQTQGQMGPIIGIEE